MRRRELISESEEYCPSSSVRQQWSLVKEGVAGQLFENEVGHVRSRDLSGCDSIKVKHSPILTLSLHRWSACQGAR